MLDHNGDVAERYSYDPFGVPTVHDATGDTIAQSAYGNNRLYTGLPWLPDLGLYDNRQRLYNPAAGRFLTQDPVHDPANLGNPYTYVGNNPGAYVDPYGDVLETVWDGFSLGLGTASLGYNLSQGNYLSAGIDAVGVALDATAAAIPFVPGGASAAIKAYRGVDIAFNAGQSAASGLDATIAASQGEYAGAAIAGVGAGLQGAHAGVRAGQIAPGLPSSVSGRQIAPTEVSRPSATRVGEQLEFNFVPRQEPIKVPAPRQEVVRNEAGGVDFAGTGHLYPAGPGQRNIVRIQYTGSRRKDYAAANQAAGFGNMRIPPMGYTWHHLDDYDPASNTGTMQLVERRAHEFIAPHYGGVAQF